MLSSGPCGPWPPATHGSSDFPSFPWSDVDLPVLTCQHHLSGYGRSRTFCHGRRLCGTGHTCTQNLRMNFSPGPGIGQASVHGRPVPHWRLFRGHLFSLPSAPGVTVPLAVVPSPVMAREHEACSQQELWVWAGSGTTCGQECPASRPESPGARPGKGEEQAGTALSGIFGKALK